MTAIRNVGDTKRRRCGMVELLCPVCRHKVRIVHTVPATKIRLLHCDRTDGGCGWRDKRSIPTQTIRL